jgi:hypothetical protein
MSSILFGISSIIDTPNTPLTYSSVRSVFSRDERFEQTKDTIKSIRKYCPEAKIFIIECSNYETNKEQLDYLKENSDYFVNIWDNKDLHKYIFSISKTLGASIMYISLFNLIIENKLLFDNYFFMSGRYYLTDKFDFNLYKNTEIIQFKINDIYTSTVIYKLTYNYMYLFRDYLINNINNNFNANIAYEELYQFFCESHKEAVTIRLQNCVCGLISVNGEKKYN